MSICIILTGDTMKKIKPYVKKYGIIAVIVVFIIVGFLFYEKPVEEEIDTYTAPKITTETPTVEYIYVDIKGEVINPGVYKVRKDTRLYYVIDLAGGFTDIANSNPINLSIILKDQDMIYIPSIHDEVVVEQPVESTLVNINTASKERLETLPSIGPATAQAIIDYRNETPFTVIEDILNVPGIGEVTFDKLKELITV